jgi:hypothetical protein
MSQKEKNNEPVLSLGEMFVNACFQPYEAFKSHVWGEVQKQDDMLRQSWGTTSKQLCDQRDKAQQLYQDMIDNNVFLAKSDALKNIAVQTQAIMRTPLDFTLDLLDKADAQRGERLQAAAGLHDQFVSASKQNQRALFRLVENSLQKFAGV